MIKKLLLLGYPVSHSISPVFQQAALNWYGMDVTYQTKETSPENLGNMVSLLRNENYLGANLTIPHKERVIEYLDKIDPWATKMGAVNTIIKDGNILAGHNTDGHAFLKSLKDKAGFDPSGESVLILGAGGSARSAAFSLAQENVKSLLIANRTPERGQSLVSALKDSINEVAAIPINDVIFEEAVTTSGLIVNATPIGMNHSGFENLSPIKTGLIHRDTLIYDMVYTPTNTPLLLAASKAGAITIGGLWMLVYQGAAAFQLWTDMEPPIDEMYEAAAKAMTCSP